MNIISGLHNSVIRSLVEAFAGTTNDVLNEIRQEYSMDTGNFKNGGSWDIRFGRIKQVALQNDLVVLTKRRGIWTFIGVLDIDTGSLYVFSKDNNLETVKKSFGKKSIHYFHAFNSLNDGPIELDNQQMSLFPMYGDDFDARRLKEAQKILGEDYPLVRQVVFVVAKEEEKKIIGVEARLYNRYFEALDTNDWSRYVPSEDYGNIYLIDELETDNTPVIEVIPKVKQEIKDRVNSKNNEIPIKKQGKHELKEEGNS